jgi:hypothetical protein
VVRQLPARPAPDRLRSAAVGRLRWAAGLKARAGQDISKTAIDKLVGQLYDAAGLPDGTQDFVNGLKDSYNLAQSVA